MRLIRYSIVVFVIISLFPLALASVSSGPPSSTLHAQSAPRTPITTQNVADLTTLQFLNRGYFTDIAVVAEESQLLAATPAGLWTFDLNQTIEPLARLPMPDEEIGRVDYHPNGTLMTIAATGKVRLWAYPDMIQLHEWDTTAAVYYRPIFSPNGEWLATLEIDNTTVTILIQEVTSGETVYRLSGMTFGADPTDYATDFMTLVFSPDGERLIAADADEVWLWNVRGQKGAPLPLDLIPTYAPLVISPNGRYLLIGTGQGGALQRLDLLTNDIQIISTDLPYINAMTLHPDGKTVWLGSNDGQIVAYAWQTLTTANPTFSITPVGIYDLEFAADGDVLITRSTYRLDAVTSRDFQAIFTQGIPYIDNEAPLTFAAASDYLYGISLGSYDRVTRAVLRWNTDLSAPYSSLETLHASNFDDGTVCALFAPQRQYLIQATGLSVTVFDLLTEESLHSWSLRRDDCRSLAWSLSHDERTLATVNTDNTVQLWSIPDGKLRGEFQKVVGRTPLQATAFSPDDQTLWMRAVDGLIAWDLTSSDFAYREFPLADAPSRPVLAISDSYVAYHNGGQVYLLPIDADGATTPILLRDDERNINTLVWNRDGSLLFMGGQQRFEVWDVATQTLVFAHTLSEAAFQQIALSPDETLIATTDAYGVVRLWGIPQ